MKKYFLLMVVATGLFSCSKKKDADAPITPIEGPKVRTETSKNGTYTYTYDGYGRQITRTHSDGSRLETSYSKTQVIQRNFDAANIPGMVVTIQLNENGTQAKSTYSTKPGNYIEYQYNNLGQMTKNISKSDGDSYVADYFYTSDNIDSVRYSKNGIWYLTNVMEYYPDQLNVFPQTVLGISYYGKSWKNQMKKLTHIQANGTIAPEDYSYEFDSFGRISKLIEVTLNGTGTVVYTYY